MSGRLDKPDIFTAFMLGHPKLKNTTSLPQTLQELTFYNAVMDRLPLGKVEAMNTFSDIPNPITISLYNCKVVPSVSTYLNFHYLCKSDYYRELSVSNVVFDPPDVARFASREAQNSLAKVVITAANSDDFYVALFLARQSSNLTEVDIAHYPKFKPTQDLFDSCPNVFAWFEYPKLSKISLVVDFTNELRFDLALACLREATPMSVRGEPLDKEVLPVEGFHPTLRELHIRLLIGQKEDFKEKCRLSKRVSELIELIKRLSPANGSGVTMTTFTLMSNTFNRREHKIPVHINKLTGVMKLQRNLGRIPNLYHIGDQFTAQKTNDFLRERLPCCVNPVGSVGCIYGYRKCLCSKRCPLGNDNGRAEGCVYGFRECICRVDGEPACKNCA
ncbi:hypothetical protein K474DRAFT_1669229 [Panus rudis PR-1116 ss-1]|nr:hypothetical protein K474DRAFT_1669229 [Panus rudis PR-1116 ss-1]